MMFRALVLCSFLHFQTVFGGSQQHLYPCYVYANCESEDFKEREVFVKDLYLKATKNELSEGFKVVKTYGIDAKDIPGILDQFCAMEDPNRKDAFDDFIAYIIEVYAGICANPFKVQDCSRWNELMELGMNLLDGYHDDGKC